MEDKEIMSKEAINELIDNLEIVEKLTLYGRKNIKYYFKKLKEENINLKLKFTDSTSRRIIEDLNKTKKANDDLKFLSDGYEIEIKKLKEENEEKDKMINLMAKHIAKEDTTEEFCDYKTVCDQNCEECVIQHFKDKVTEK